MSFWITVIEENICLSAGPEAEMPISEGTLIPIPKAREQNGNMWPCGLHIMY